MGVAAEYNLPCLMEMVKGRHTAVRRLTDVDGNADSKRTEVSLGTVVLYARVLSHDRKKDLDA